MKCAWSLVGLWLFAQFDDGLCFHSTLAPTTSLRPTGTRSSPGKPSSSPVTQLQVSPLTTIASSPVGAITLLAGIVLIHEAGHYLAARSFNISVLEFSIGFGPKIVGFEALGNEFNLRALPLGGFVRFPENYDVRKVQEQEEAARQAFMNRRKEENWTLWQDAINILTLGVWDEQRRQRRKRELAAATAAALQAKNNNVPRWQWPWKRQVEQKLEADPEDVEIDYYDDPNLLQNRPWQERAVVISGGVVFNLILAFVLYFGEIKFGSGIPQPVFDSGVVVSQAPRPDGASAGLLRQGDIIVGINGRPVVLASPTPMSAQKEVTDLVSVIRETPTGESVKLQVLRDTRELDVTVVPQRTGSIQAIGVLLGPNFKEIQKLKSNDYTEAAELAYRYLSQVVSQTWDGVRSLLGGLLMGQGPPPGQSVSGPIGLIKSGTDVVATQDLTAVLLFAAALSVNLGVINALPLPALDGGQLAFLIAEAVTGKKVDQRLQGGITNIVVLLLLLSSISVAISDVGSILSGR